MLNDIKINISLILEKINVFRAAFKVYIRVEQKFTNKKENNPIHSQEIKIKKKSNTQNNNITLVANKFNK